MGNDVNTTNFGVHYMLDGYGADVGLLNDKEQLLHILHTIPEEMGMHKISEPQVVVAGPNNHKDPGGLSGFVMIAESHVSFHTFPNRGFVTIDVYTCQDHIDADLLTKKFVAAFRISDYDEKVIDRGTKYPVRDIYA
jgi:S-adenosylmethionine decarboxylase